ncbi:uncharacterized protein [Antedon mediterranea]|uniref:uncharacterized protein n=1 Tax=Antedon mediterranea TaxID=105859 RepID=UPI003AF43B6E
MWRKNKAAGPDGVVIEMIGALEEYGVEKLTEVINKIYEDGSFPEDLTRSRLNLEIGSGQFGFVKDSGTRNAIFVTRMITERAVEMQKDVYMCFIDYTNAFDKVRHEQLFQELNKLDLHGKGSSIVVKFVLETDCMHEGRWGVQ